MAPDQSLAAVTSLGEPQPAGTYLLRIRVHQPVLVRFGRFQNGRAFFIPPADYLYVGSARGRRGSTTVAHRLLRHAGRSLGEPAHPIRAQLLVHFGRSPLTPANPKKLHWHVDYLLDESAAELTQIILIHSEAGLEEPLGRWLLGLAETAVIAPGLGAADIKGSTHLLRVPAEDAWWRSLIDQIGEQYLDDID